MKYTIEFELPDNDTVLAKIFHSAVHWAIWGYSGYCYPKPVVEPKRGKWKHRKTWSMYVCDQCGFENQEASNYCPHCGADMRGEEDE